MDQGRRYSRDDPDEPLNEGVRIIGAEEAQEALERGDVAQRRGDDMPRYGDRPRSRPADDGTRPVLRFPLGSSSDPSEIGRGPVSEPISEPVELPHWTQPPTGQVPQILPDQPPSERDDLEDWASFATSAPRWRDDAGGGDEPYEDEEFWSGEHRLGALDTSHRPSDDDFLSFADLDEPPAGRSVFADVEGQDAGYGEPAGGWDDAPGFLEEPDPYDAPPTRRIATGQRVGRPTGTHRAPRGGGGGGGMDRDITQAAAVGLAFLAVAAILFKIGPPAAMILVTAVIGVTVAELYGVLQKVGYHPISIVGIAGSVGMVIGGYNYGYEAIPTVLFLTTATCLVWYLAGAGTEQPVISIGVTLLGVLWVGLFGTFAAFMLAIQGPDMDPGIGVLMTAILGTVGYDVGGLFVGRSAGRSPLSAASPNKTWEGLIGGCAIAFILCTILGLIGMGSMDSLGSGVLVGLTVAVAAPLGDLCQSLVKRDLGVKDMGSILPGHGGFMDRFDALLFVLPAVWLVFEYQDYFLR